MKRDGAHVDHVEQGFEVVDYDVADVALGIFGIDLLPAHPARNKFRGILLKERFACYTVGVPGQHQRAIFQVRKEERSDGAVVFD